jgi:hypothetical protein
MRDWGGNHYKEWFGNSLGVWWWWGWGFGKQLMTKLYQEDDDLVFKS